MAFEYPVREENNGHTDNIALTKPKTYNAEKWQESDRLLPHISGGNLPGQRFVAESVHFHWGSNFTHGSEHVIDGARYAMEMHIVHRNTKYQTVAEAQINEDGLAVVAVLFAVNLTMTTDFAGLKSIINLFGSIAGYDTAAEIENFKLEALLGNINREDFYTYKGSITTPPCSRAVTWIVFEHVLSITLAQMERFHALRDSNGAVLQNNYRALQAKGQRTVYLRRKTQIPESGFWKIQGRSIIN